MGAAPRWWYGSVPVMGRDLVVRVRRSLDLRPRAGPLGRLVVTIILMAACGGDEAPTPTVPAPAPAPPPPSPPEPQGPTVPANLRISSLGGDFIEWSWDAVEGVDGYRVQFSENEAFTEADDVILRTPEQLSYRREGLPPGAGAYLRVQSVIRRGEETTMSEWSRYVQGMTVAPPAAPMNLRVSASDRDFIEWTWDAVEAADGYDVQFSDDEEFTDADEVISRTAGQLFYRREGLPPDANAYLRVQSVVRVGEVTVTSEWSENVVGTAAPPPPSLLVTLEEFNLAEGETIEFEVRLTTQPRADVFVAVSAQFLSDVLLERSKDALPLRIAEGSRLTFNVGTWNAAQRVVLVAEEDYDNWDEVVSVYFDTVSDDAAYGRLPRLVIPGSIADDDSYFLDIIEFGAFFHTPPEGVTWHYAASLSGMPSSDVSVRVTVGDPGVAVVSHGDRLLFTRENFRVPQRFSLTGVVGRNYAGTDVHLEASGGGYDGIAFEVSLEYYHGDPEIVLSDRELHVSEGETVPLFVRPSTEFGDDVFIRVVSYDPDTISVVGGTTTNYCSSRFEGCDRGRSYRDLSFDGDDWMIDEEVVLEAQHDDDAENEEVVVFVVAFDSYFSGSRSDYGAVVVTVHDDDSP